MRFDDIGAIVYYLKAIPWQISDIAIDRYYVQLGELHDAIQEHGGIVVESHNFYIEARK